MIFNRCIINRFISFAVNHQLKYCCEALLGIGIKLSINKDILMSMFVTTKSPLNFSFSVKAPCVNPIREVFGKIDQDMNTLNAILIAVTDWDQNKPISPSDTSYRHVYIGEIFKQCVELKNNIEKHYNELKKIPKDLDYKLTPSMFSLYDKDLVTKIDKLNKTAIYYKFQDPNEEYEYLAGYLNLEGLRGQVKVTIKIYGKLNVDDEKS